MVPDSFIPGFEDQLVGAKIGEDVEVNVTFPEEYHAKDLAGKAAVFKCKVNAISVKELPELDDEFAQEVSEFDTLDEYKADVKKNLEEKKAAEAKTAKENEAVDKAVENAQMDIPDPMIDSQVEQHDQRLCKKNAVPGSVHGAVHAVYRHNTGCSERAGSSAGSDTDQVQTGSGEDRRG